MQLPGSYGIEFAPNRSKKNLLIPYLFCGLFIVFGLVLVISGAADTEYWHNPDDKVGTGTVLFGSGLLFLLISHFLTSPFNVHYFVGKDGITLQAFRTRRQIPFTEIDSVTPLEEGKSEKFVLQLQNQMVERQKQNITEARESQQEKDLGNMWEQTKNAFKQQTSAYQKFKFLSVAVVYSSSGRQRGPRRASSANLPCATVFILLKNGENFFISPLDIEGFAREARKYLVAQSHSN